MAQCPDCDALIPKRKKMSLGQLVECPECGTALEVISLEPFEVDYYLGDEWEEEEEDDY
ncbi:MAG: lysine biosynthesis protein LysW [Chloroflexia bacterium]|nr:lysine biosynthesis protein LysW [Chloroflexia bacterium]